MSHRTRPKVIVFDLDYTLWPFWVDSDFTPPFNKGSDGIIYDKRNRQIRPYPEVHEILQRLTSEGYLLGVASRTEYIEGAERLLHLFDWNKFFTFKEIYPSCKVTHFTRIQKSSAVPFSEMMFFDDEHRNIWDIKKIGVFCVLVEQGVTNKLIDKSLETFAQEEK